MRRPLLSCCFRARLVSDGISLAKECKLRGALLKLAMPAGQRSRGTNQDMTECFPPILGRPDCHDLTARIGGFFGIS